MDAERIWRGDYSRFITARILQNGEEAFSHDGVFCAHMDTTGTVREIRIGDTDRKHIVDYESARDYLDSLSEWNTPDRGVAAKQSSG